VKLILSHHDFQGSPHGLRPVVKRMQAESADYLKIAMMARTPEDLRELMRVQRELGARGIVVAMGEYGAPARVLAARLGSPWTYASPTQGDPTAPGQFSEEILRDVFRYEKIGAYTRAFCVAGDPVRHSMSPALFNALFRRAGLDALYVPARIPAGSLMDSLEAIGIEGASVTIPHKEEAYRNCRADRHSEQARAVNTLHRRGGAWEGSNTDSRGFLTSLESFAGHSVSGLRAVVLGYGGAARSVAAALSPRNEVLITGRNEARARELAEELGVRWVPLDRVASSAYHLLVNATPAGMEPDREGVPVPADDLLPGTLVYDCVYTPRETRLLREARDRGCRAVGGVGMFVEQAILQAAYWFGEDIRPAMRETVAEFLAKTE